MKAKPLRGLVFNTNQDRKVYTMTAIIDANFTDLECEVLYLLVACLNTSSVEEELDNGNVCLLLDQDLECVTGGPKVARGVISSLVKKGWIAVEQNGQEGRTEYWAEDKLLPYLFALADTRASA